MLSNQELDRLSEADVGTRLVEAMDLSGHVRMELYPVRRVVVDFILKSTDATEGSGKRVGTWPDSSLASIRLSAEQARAQQSSELAPRQRAMALALRTVPMTARTVVPVQANRLMPTDASLNVNEIFDIWHREHLSGRKDGGESVYRSMHKDVLPNIGSVPIANIDRDAIANVLQQIIDRGSSRQAGCVLADLRQMFRWALQGGWIDDDPTSTLSKVEVCGAQKARSRTLSNDEVRELAQRMGSAGLARHIRHATWLMLATGARIGEVANARWRDIDFTARTWTIPESFSHSGRAHVIPLSDFAIRHFSGDGTMRRSSEWVFPGRFDSEPLSPKALGKQIRDRQRGTQIRGRSAATTVLLLPGGAWTPLDLRRTAASMLADLGVMPDVIAACLDHGLRSDDPGQTAGSSNLDACRAAFDQLGRHLDAIENPAGDTRRKAA